MTTTSLDLMPAVTEKVRAAAELLQRNSLAVGCGCPAWNIGPDTTPVAHDADCLLHALDDVFAAFGEVGPAIQAAVDASAGYPISTTGIANSLLDIDQGMQVHAVVGYALALCGITYTQVSVTATLEERSFELEDPVAARYAVANYLSSSGRVPLGPEVVGRLLLSTRPGLEIVRAKALIAEHDPNADVLSIEKLLASTVASVNNEAAALANSAPNTAGLRFDLQSLASDGFNLVVGRTG